MQRIQAILFDVGDVLTDHGATRDLLRAYDRQLRWPEGTLHERLYRSPWWERVSLGQISETAYFYGAVGEVAPILPQALEVLRYGCFALEPLRPEMVDLLQALARRYRLGLVSNASPSLRHQLIRWPHVLGLFEVVLISAEVGLRKPDPRIYRLALRRLQLAPEEVLFVDDKARNVEGARAVGMEGIVFTSPAQLREELRARGLWEGEEAETR
ncbi:MAG: HAD family hydrolase [Anaerolineae bacterium]